MTPIKAMLSVFAVCAAFILAYFLFSLKYEVMQLETKKRILIGQIKSNQAALHTLQAEWTYLNDPARLKSLIDAFTDLRPAAGRQVVPLDKADFSETGNR